ncbi:2Fe-2S iron-sulfur cluster-binding protein [Rhizobium laguerreae]|uniref:2Fe-2S iron-sulfur cluster-binding protein n=1 Tax=Rhizobium laguerreae TaxID=1076926 RepID=UPI00103FB83D|nr:2Fe-2S iron-sulfur cluster-binding protein [Rhizobium laguerreae]TBX98596.1 2Fe-2S iron-sulfur cluster binding domain-containing protein [Rhizobium laguerreae]
MLTITFILPDGTERSCTAMGGMSLMEVALKNSIPGIVAECNGAAACGTCHVVFADDVGSFLSPVTDHENDMLDFTAAPREPGSRLSCQIKIDDRLEGASVRVPDAS